MKMKILICMSLIVFASFGYVSEFELNDTLYHDIPIFSERNVSYACELGNKNTSLCYYNETYISGYRKTPYEGWIGLNEIELEDGECAKIRQITKGAMRYGDIEPVDIIPYIKTFSELEIEKVTADDIFTNLISVDNEINQQVMIYEMCAPKSSKIKIKDYLSTEFLENGETKKWSASDLPQTKWAWWNATWKAKRNITITNNAGKAYDSYVHRIRVKYNSSMKNDFTDLRFIDSSNNSLNYWIQPEYTVNGDYATIWLNYTLPSSSEVISMYYNYTGASDISDARETFRFFDHFDLPNNAMNTTLWDNAWETQAVSSSFAYVAGDGIDGHALDAGAASEVSMSCPNCTSHFYANVSDGTGTADVHIQLGQCENKDITGGYGEFDTWLWDPRTNGGDLDALNFVSNDGTGADNIGGTTSVLTYSQMSEFGMFSLFSNDSNSIFSHNYTKKYVHDSPPLSVADAHIFTRGHKKGWVIVDYAFMTREVSPAPTYAFGDAEGEAAIPLFLNLSITYPLAANTTAITSSNATFYFNLSYDMPISQCEFSVARIGYPAVAYSNTTELSNGSNAIYALFGFDSHNSSHYFNVTCSGNGSVQNDSVEFLVLLNLGDAGDISDWGNPTNITCSGNNLQKSYILSINGVSYFRTESINCKYGCYAEKCRGTDAEENAILAVYLIILPLLIIFITDMLFMILSRVMDLS